MFCKNCGSEMGDNRFCSNCGADAVAEASNSVENMGAYTQEKPAEQAKESGMAENLAGLFCYLFGWLTGIIFLLIDKRPFVRFHAAQSIVTFGAIWLFTIVFNRIIYILPYSIWSILRGASTLIGIGGFVLAVFLMVQAYKGTSFKLPVVGAIAEQMVNKNKI